MKKEMKKIITKGFITKNGNPTNNAINMYFVYLYHLPKDWNMKKINQYGLQKVREFFGVDYGFDVMILWGINLGCAKSKTSKKRYECLSKALTLGEAMKGAGVVYSDKKII